MVWMYEEWNLRPSMQAMLTCTHTYFPSLSILFFCCSSPMLFQNSRNVSLNPRTGRPLLFTRQTRRGWGQVKTNKVEQWRGFWCFGVSLACIRLLKDSCPSDTCPKKKVFEGETALHVRRPVNSTLHALTRWLLPLRLGTTNSQWCQHHRPSLHCLPDPS